MFLDDEEDKMKKVDMAINFFLRKKRKGGKFSLSMVYGRVSCHGQKRYKVIEWKNMASSGYFLQRLSIDQDKDGVFGSKVLSIVVSYKNKGDERLWFQSGLLVGFYDSVVTWLLCWHDGLMVEEDENQWKWQ